MIVHINPLRFACGAHTFCIDVLRIRKNGHKNNNAGDLSGDLIDQFKGLTCEIDFHLLTDNSWDVKGFIVLFTPLVVEFAELSVLVWLCFFCPAVFLIAVPEISKRHVFTFIHLPEYPLKIRLLVFRTAVVTSGDMTVNQLRDGIISDPFRKRIRKFIALFKGSDEVIDP